MQSYNLKYKIIFKMIVMIAVKQGFAIRYGHPGREKIISWSRLKQSACSRTKGVLIFNQKLESFTDNSFYSDIVMSHPFIMALLIIIY